MFQSDETKKYALAGMAATLPGIELVLALIERQLAEMRAVLADAPGAEPPAPTGKRGWPADPAARKAERKRRVVARLEATKRKKISAANKAVWAGMSVRQRKARLAAMAAGRKQQVVEMKKKGAA